jgi:hypothetical protein
VTRNLILLIAAAVSIGIATADLTGPQGVAWGQSATINLAAAMTTLGAAAGTTPLVQDNFDDNKRGNLWKQYTDDPNCKVQEANKRLEFVAKYTPKSPIFAGYVADKWCIDPNHDFAMRVDLSYDLVTMNGGWFSFGVTPTPDLPRKQYVSMGIGCVSVYPSYWREYKDGYEVRWDFDSRGYTRQTLYISYNAESDSVYLSDTGYGADEAWQTLTDVIKARWPKKPLYVFLGGSAETLQIDAGHAFADNFAVDSATIVNPNAPPVDPGKPIDPNTKPTEVTGEAAIMPSVIKRAGPAQAISTFLSLPEGLLPSDVDETKPLVLLPGAAEAKSWTTFLWLSGRVVVIGSFDRTKLLETVTTNGEVTVQVMGTLKDGRRFGGTDTVTIQ